VYECASVARSLRSNLITRHYRFIKRRLNFPFTAFIEPSDRAGRRIRKDRHVSRVQCVSSALVRLLIIVRNRSAKRITNKRAPHSHVRTRRGYHLRSGFRAAIFLASNNRQELAWHRPCVCQQVSIPSSAAARGGDSILVPGRLAPGLGPRDFAGPHFLPSSILPFHPFPSHARAAHPACSCAARGPRATICH